MSDPASDGPVSAAPPTPGASPGDPRPRPGLPPAPPPPRRRPPAEAPAGSASPSAEAAGGDDSTAGAQAAAGAARGAAAVEAAPAAGPRARPDRGRRHRVRAGVRRRRCRPGAAATPPARPRSRSAAAPQSRGAAGPLDRGGAPARPRRPRRRWCAAPASGTPPSRPRGRGGAPATARPASGGRVATPAGAAPAKTPAKRRRGGRGRRRAAARAGERARRRRGRDARAPPAGGGHRGRRPYEIDDETLERRRGRERKGRPVGRYLMAVSVKPTATQIAVLEGRGADRALRLAAGRRRPPDRRQHLPRPGAERAARHGGGLRRHRHAQERRALPGRRPLRQPTTSRTTRAANAARIEQLLKTGQTIVCQVTKNPIGTKGARLTQEVSLPGRFVVLIPNSDTYGISKRLPDDERKRLRADPRRHPARGPRLIVRTAAEGASADELRRDVARLQQQWDADRGPGGQRPRRRRCSTGSPTWPCGSSARSSTRSTGASSSTTARCTRRCATTSPASAPSWPTGSSTTTTRGEPLPDLRALPRPRAAPQGARPQGVAAVGRLADHRAHRGAHRHRRQHRQERRHVEPRGDRLPQQPGGGRGDRPPAAPARHRRHHRHRLHRHGDPRQPRARSSAPSATRWPGTRPAPRCSTSPSSAWWR